MTAHEPHAPDAEMMAILSALAAAPVVDLRAMPIEGSARDLRAQSGRLELGAGGDGRDAGEIVAPGAAGPPGVRPHRPPGADDLPVIRSCMAGGWTFGSIDTHDGAMRCLALASGCAVLGFDYRLAPEHPFPAPLDDVLAVLAHVEAGGLGPGFDRRRLALAAIRPARRCRSAR